MNQTWTHLCLQPEFEREYDHRVGWLWQWVVKRHHISLASCLDKLLNSESPFSPCQHQQWESSSSRAHVNHPYSCNHQKMSEGFGKRSLLLLWWISSHSQYGEGLTFLSVCTVLFLQNKSIFLSWSICQILISDSDSKKVFNNTISYTVPPHRPFDCAINLLPGTMTPE